MAEIAPTGSSQPAASRSGQSPRAPAREAGSNGAGGEAARLLTAAEVAARWQVPKGQVYRLQREGKLPAVCIGRYRRWRLEAVEAFEAGGGVDA